MTYWTVTSDILLHSKITNSWVSERGVWPERTCRSICGSFRILFCCANTVHRDWGDYPVFRTLGSRLSSLWTNTCVFFVFFVFKSGFPDYSPWNPDTNLVWVQITQIYSNLLNFFKSPCPESSAGKKMGMVESPCLGVLPWVCFLLEQVSVWIVQCRMTHGPQHWKSHNW